MRIEASAVNSQKFETFQDPILPKKDYRLDLTIGAIRVALLAQK